MRLLLIRHGQTDDNIAGRLGTRHPGPGLTPLGIRQAAAVPAAFRDDPVDGIFASTLIRAQLTAEPIATSRDLEITVLPGIHEIEAGDLEGRNDPASVRIYLETAFAWGRGQLDTEMPGGTNGHTFFDRFDTDVLTIHNRLAGAGSSTLPGMVIATPAGNPTAIAFSHGAAIRVWVARRATNIPPSFAGENQLDNTGVVELDGSPDAGWTLLSWQGKPIGGPKLAGSQERDPGGEALADARKQT